MPTTQIHDPVLARFRTALDEIYGNRIDRVILFGSRARGDARPDSDYDVAVFLRDMDDRYPELRRLADLSTDFIAETGEFVHAMPYRAGSYNEPTPLMLGIRTDGVDL
jgi:predicted nucleotidyltransferase